MMEVQVECRPDLTRVAAVVDGNMVAVHKSVAGFVHPCITVVISSDGSPVKVEVESADHEIPRKLRGVLLRVEAQMGEEELARVVRACVKAAVPYKKVTIKRAGEYYQLVERREGGVEADEI